MLEWLKLLFRLKHKLRFTFFFFLEFQPMTSASNNNFLLSDQDANRFLVLTEIKLQISYSTIKNFTS